MRPGGGASSKSGGSDPVCVSESGVCVCVPRMMVRSGLVVAQGSENTRLEID
jgi:hypothetical protein